MRRRFIFLALLLSAAFAAPHAATAQQPAEASATLHVTHTYLRAKPGLRDDLIAYIRANWFAMDRIGIEQGLFTNYALLERSESSESSEADWDVIVAVGYPTIDGHDAPGVADGFRAIRAAHQEIKINGRGLAELGEIVEHHPLKLVTHS
jgi:hypothetical protein